MFRAVRVAFPGLILVALGRTAGAGRLQRNAFAGIRIPSTMRSDEAWVVGHRAAASALTIAGLGYSILAAVASARRLSGGRQRVLFRTRTRWLLGWLAVAVARANQAARVVGTG